MTLGEVYKFVGNATVPWRTPRQLKAFYPSVDTPAEIEVCLHCRKDRCTNCLRKLKEKHYQ